MHTFESASAKRISYVLAIKNRAQYLERSLPLICDLKGPNDELIIVDGKSTDNTAEVVNRYLDKVDIFISEEDINAGYAQNKGLLLAQGKYIKILTDDDVFYPEAMEQAVQVMEAHPEVDILLCGGTIEIQHENRCRTLYFPPGTNYGKEPEDIFRYTGSGSGIFKRRRVLSKVGLRDPNSFASDGELLARSIYLGANVKFCRINMYHHIIYPHSFTVAHKKEWRAEMFRICWKYCSKKFYFKYRYRVMSRKYPLLRYVLLLGYVLWPLRILYRMLRVLGIRKQHDGTQKRGLNNDQEPIWDGGFS